MGPDVCVHLTKRWRIGIGDYFLVAADASQR